MSFTDFDWLNNNSKKTIFKFRSLCENFRFDLQELNRMADNTIVRNSGVKIDNKLY